GESVNRIPALFRDRPGAATLVLLTPRRPRIFLGAHCLPPGGHPFARAGHEEHCHTPAARPDFFAESTFATFSCVRKKTHSPPMENGSTFRGKRTKREGRPRTPSSGSRAAPDDLSYTFRSWC